MTTMRPETEKELAEIIAASERPLRIEGGGTRAIGGQTSGQDLLTLSGLSGVTLHEPGALTLVAGAGTPLAEVEESLATEGQRLAFEPMDHRGLLGRDGVPTLGGVIAANVSGPRRISAGAARDFLLGVRFVDGRGQILKNGGRVMKNVTGYDLVKLIAGSWGTLGVISEVALKVLPIPETMATLILDGLSPEIAVKAMSRALASPFDVSGAAHAMTGPSGHEMTAIRVEGFSDSVAYRVERLTGQLAEFAPVRVDFDGKRCATLWRWLRDVGAFHRQDGDVWKISVKPSDAPAVVARLQALDVLLDWGGGLIWARMPEGCDARPRLADVAGHATLVRASDATRAQIATFHPEPPILADLSARLRAKFDPRGILNAGLMG